MKRRYTRMKWKLLLLVAAVTGLAGGAGGLLMKCAFEGAWKEPVVRFFVWLCGTFFGQSEAEALATYRVHLYAHRRDFLYVGVMLIMLCAFCLAMGQFTRWLNRISAGVRRVVDGTGEPVALPRDLAPIQADLNSIQATLREREEEARQTEQRKNDLLVFLAHDLKTPLTSVIGYLTLLRDDPDLSQEQRAKYTGIALDKAQRLEELMLEFFDITRDSLHERHGLPERVQLSVLLEQICDEFMPQFQEKRLRCVTDIQPRLTVTGEADKLARVFDNVLRNAVSYSEEGGAVEVQAAERGKSAVVTIRNEGLEIPEQELTLIFQKFYRLDAARSTRTGGAGLGLAIAREIVEAHGGSIHAESNGRKTAFVIELPRESEA